MRYFPIFVDLANATVLVAGGGEQAAQKVRLLRRTAATIHVCAPELCAELASLEAAGTIRHVAHSFSPDLLDGCRLAYAASGDEALDRTVAEAARARRIEVNTVDRPELCSFITPAIVDRDPLVVAIGTEGAAPVMARQVKAHLEAHLPAGLGRLLRFAAGLRDEVARRIEGAGERRRFWEQFFAGPAARAGLDGAFDEAAAQSRDLLDSREATQGLVTLVGAGPGDPDLLTFKAMRALQTADVIVADRLVPDAILEVARRDARRIFVGKTPGQPSISQEEINAILVREGLAGHHVVRLKGGDPFIFGRGAEEIRALRAAGIETAVVPGITAALAAAAEADISLTERGERRSLTIMTGHASHGPAEHDWQRLARPGQALAIYMGVGAAPVIRQRLLAAGMDPCTPVTVVENATLPSSRAVHGEIARLESMLRHEAITGPAMIFIGARPIGAASATTSRKAA